MIARVLTNTLKRKPHEQRRPWKRASLVGDYAHSLGREEHCTIKAVGLPRDLRAAGTTPLARITAEVVRPASVVLEIIFPACVEAVKRFEAPERRGVSPFIEAQMPLPRCIALDPLESHAPRREMTDKEKTCDSHRNERSLVKNRTRLRGASSPRQPRPPPACAPPAAGHTMTDLGSSD